jgi:hypothetical protein
MGTPRGALMKAVINAVIANPYSRPNEIGELLGKEAGGVSNVLSKLYRAGVLGRKKCRYYFKGFKAQKQVKPAPVKEVKQVEQKESKQLELPLFAVPLSPYSRIESLEKEVYELKVQLLDQYAIIKYLEDKLENHE